VILEHYSKRPLGPISAVRQDCEPDVKPFGLWVSVAGPDDWPNWCRGEDFMLERLACRHVVELASDANVLRIDSLAALDHFHRSYSAPILPSGSSYSMGVNWAEVAARWQGIIIAPYQWQRRIETGWLWYYGWDCASGCIWDPAAIADVQRTLEAA
jgi:hypothetical protein